MPAQVHEGPANDDWAGGEGAHGDEAYSCVLGVKFVVDCQEDAESDDEEGNAEGDKRGAEV